MQKETKSVMSSHLPIFKKGLYSIFGLIPLFLRGCFNTKQTTSYADIQHITYLLTYLLIGWWCERQTTQSYTHGGRIRNSDFDFNSMPELFKGQRDINIGIKSAGYAYLALSTNPSPADDVEGNVGILKIGMYYFYSKSFAELSFLKLK